ncbi:hypothetical protein ACR777_10265 [Sphingobacterium spiritivorum]|uniref:Uncharacterized protein n=1 Tax=Sphingobacterium spiritivorum TaxID=258 RepID=A0A380CL51_SPHSI|nr:hypothetical protein [Sphingobacterium spiritivorum]SUJ22061.1 Uncharacterised protein [Sphingobacterium spiritivorum]
MKRILLALLVIGTTIGLSSCTKEYITNSLPGVSYVYTVSPGDWQRVSGTNSFVREIAISNLDERYFEDGHVSVAISYDTAPTVYEIIPAEIDDYSFSANYSIGRVRVYAKDISGLAPVAPAKLLVKVVLTDAEIGN